MSDVLETIATPFFALVDFALAAPVAAIGTVAAADLAIALLMRAAV